MMINSHLHTIEVHVRFEETDMMGIVWHGNYLRYLEMGRFEWVRKLLNLGSLTDPNISHQFVVKTIKIEYFAPAKFDNTLTVNTEVKEINRVRIVFNQTIMHLDRLIISGEVSLVCVDLQGKIQPIPTSFLELFI